MEVLAGIACSIQGMHNLVQSRHCTSA